MSPLQRFKKLDVDRQTEILDAAAAEFATHGFNGASVNRVIKATGLSKGAFYYYFEGKDDLFVTVFRAYEARAARGLDLDPRHLTKATYWPTMTEWSEHMMDLVMTTPHWVGLGKAFYEIPSDQWYEGVVGEYLAERLGEFATLVGRGQTLGVVRSDLPAEVLVELWMAANTVLDGYTLKWWDDTPQHLRKGLMAIQLDVLKRILTTEMKPLEG